MFIFKEWALTFVLLYYFSIIQLEKMDEIRAIKELRLESMAEHGILVDTEDDAGTSAMGSGEQKDKTQ